MKHTPGPWLVHEDGEANFYTVLDSKGNWLLRIQHNGEPLLAKQRANLHMIAAAPDLIAALLEFVGSSAIQMHHPKKMAAARAAIAKATAEG